MVSAKEVTVGVPDTLIDDVMEGWNLEILEYSLNVHRSVVWNQHC